MKSIIKATSYPKTHAVQPAYTQISQTEWGKGYIKVREFEEQINFGLWHKEGGWCDDEVVIRWYKKDNKLRLEVSDSSITERQQAIHPEMFKLLQNDTTSPTAVKDKLLDLGYLNVSDKQ